MNRSIRFSALALLSVGATCASAVAYAALSPARDARVTFQAVGPAGLEIDGSTSELRVTEGDGNVVVEVPLDNLTTGIALRDRHMKEKYLEVGKFPSATLTVARAALKVPAAGGTLEADVPARVILHGQSRPVTVHYAASADTTGVAVDGKFHVKMDEFGIAVPTYLGVTVKPDVDVSAKFRVAGG
jgi:polyisoprenoid-binding protein YceI